jgi:hypothetical protein
VCTSAAKLPSSIEGTSPGLVLLKLSSAAVVSVLYISCCCYQYSNTVDCYLPCYRLQSVHSAPDVPYSSDQSEAALAPNTPSSHATIIPAHSSNAPTLLSCCCCCYCIALYIRQRHMHIEPCDATRRSFAREQLRIHSKANVGSAHCAVSARFVGRCDELR